MDENIYSELYHRFKKPWCNSFALYLIFVVGVLGGTGIWLPLFKKGPFSIEEFAINIITYSCALIVPAAVNIFVTIKNYKNIVSLVIITLVLVASVIFCVAYSVFNDALWTSIICCVLSLILWVIANSDNEQLLDDSFRQDIKDKSEKLDSNW